MKVQREIRIASVEIRNDTYYCALTRRFIYKLNCPITFGRIIIGNVFKMYDKMTSSPSKFSHYYYDNGANKVSMCRRVEGSFPTPEEKKETMGRRIMKKKELESREQGRPQVLEGIPRRNKGKINEKKDLYGFHCSERDRIEYLPTVIKNLFRTNYY